jgi:branched-chain amino acid aminotransferase
MSECYHKLFILNGEIEDTASFNIDYVFRGESLYELFRIIDGIPLFWEDHIERLYRTSEITGLHIWYNPSDLIGLVDLLIRSNGVQEGNIKLVFNFRSQGKEREENFLAYFVEPVYPTPEQYANGVYGILFQASRINPTAKIINQNLRIAVYKQLIEKGAYEALLVDRNGFISEGSRSNIFLIKDEEVFTAPDSTVLSGIARKHVIATCHSLDIPVRFKCINIEELATMDSVFMTGTSPRVLPFSRIDTYKFKPDNPVLLKISEGFNQEIMNYILERGT